MASLAVCAFSTFLRLISECLSLQTVGDCVHSVQLTEFANDTMKISQLK